MAKKRKATRKKHNPKLKKAFRTKGSRLVHGYETTRRHKRKR
jgi:hypothetical protein